MVEIMENFLKALRSPEVVANLKATDVYVVSHPGSNEAGSCVKADKLVTCQHGTEQYSTVQYSAVQSTLDLAPSTCPTGQCPQSTPQSAECGMQCQQCSVGFHNNSVHKITTLWSCGVHG